MPNKMLKLLSVYVDSEDGAYHVTGPECLSADVIHAAAMAAVDIIEPKLTELFSQNLETAADNA